MRPALAMLTCLLCVSAAQATPASVTIGDVVLDYDDAEWRVVVPGPTATLTCLAEGCGEGATVDIGTGPIDVPIADLIHIDHYNLWPLWREGDGPFDPADIEREFNGLTIRGVVKASNCHAYTPPALRAAFDHGGRRYHVLSGLSSGCAPFVESVSEVAFRDLLKGFRPAP